MRLTEFAGFSGDGSVVEASPRALDRLLWRPPRRIGAVLAGVCARVVVVGVLDLGGGVKVVVGRE
jgi:hypothetical protein